MIDRLRLALNRPLRDGERPRLFALAVVVIVGAGAAFALLGDGDTSTERSRAASASSALSPASPAAPPELAARPTASINAPSEEGKPEPALEASPSDVAQAKRAARRFLAGYLPYSYGTARASEIRAVSVELRRRLTRDRPRVTGRERHRRPRVELLQADGVDHRHANVVALVSDGARRYTTPLELERTSAGWRVADVGS